MRTSTIGAATLLLMLAGCATSPDDRLQSALHSNDQNKLEFIARYDHDHDHRVAALARLTDRRTALALAREDEEEAVRVFAVRLLDDEQAILERALNDGEESVRLAAISALREQSSLVAVALHQTYLTFGEERRAADARITDRQLLVRESIAAIDRAQPDWNKISLPDGWVHNDWAPMVAANPEQPDDLRKRAVKVMDNTSPEHQKILISVYETAVNNQLQELALARINDEQFLATYLRNAYFAETRQLQALVGRLSSAASLADLVRTAPDQTVRCHALFQISDRSVLEPLSNISGDFAAGQLVQIALVLNDPEIRTRRPGLRAECFVTDHTTDYRGTQTYQSGVRLNGAIVQRSLTLTIRDAAANVYRYQSAVMKRSDGHRGNVDKDSICNGLSLPESMDSQPRVTCPFIVEEALIVRNILIQAELDDDQLRAYTASPNPALQSAARQILGIEAIPSSRESTLWPAQ